MDTLDGNAARIKAIVFDIGETLIDETRYWSAWADWLGVTRLTLFACLGATISNHGHHHDALRLFRPGLDVDAELAAMHAQGISLDFVAADLYPDAVASLARLRRRGFRIGVAGNQPVSTIPMLRQAGIEADFIGVSDGWNLKKPAAAFFHRVISECAPLAPGDILYVGDRHDHDIVPARAAGMQAAWLQRGRWASVHRLLQHPAEDVVSFDSLSALADTLTAPTRTS